MALFELNKDPTPPSFKECVAADIGRTFFNQSEHAQRRTVDGKEALVVLEDASLTERKAHWEAGVKQNFDTGLYLAVTILYIRSDDYGPRPKVGKQLVMDRGTERQRTFSILSCEEEAGVYRITMERTRQ